VLSSNAAVALVERDDLAKIGDEAKVQQLAGNDATALGKLANADGLLFLDQRADGAHVRFTTVNLGYALFDDPVPSGTASFQRLMLKPESPRVIELSGSKPRLISC